MSKIPIVLIFGMSSFIFETEAPSPSAILKGTNSALTIIGSIVDFLNIHKEEDNFEHLAAEFSSFKKEWKASLTSIFQKIDKSTYQNVLTGYVNRIDSCEEDYNDFIANPSEATKKNLLKCSDIMHDVRPIGKYLSGESIIDAPPLFELFKKEGICNGSAMESVFKSLFADYLTGCTIAHTIAIIENTGHLYANDCKVGMSEIQNNVKELYRDCAPSSCTSIYCYVENQIGGSLTMTPKSLHESLSNEYPWFSYLILQTSRESEVTVEGNFSARHSSGHWKNPYKYDIIYFDSNIQLTSERKNYSLFMEVSLKFLESYYFGDSTFAKNFGLNFGTFSGFASENNVLCDDTMPYNRQCYGPSAANSLNPELYIIFSFFLFILCT